MIMREVQIDSESNVNETSLPFNSVSILSTYQSGSVGGKCHIIVDNARKICRKSAHLVKVSAFGAPFKVNEFSQAVNFALFSLQGQRLGTECLSEIARKCNRKAVEALNSCSKLVNFLLVDYPNYPADRQSLVRKVFNLNLKRVKSLRRRKRAKMLSLVRKCAKLRQ